MSSEALSSFTLEASPLEKPANDLPENNTQFGTIEIQCRFFQIIKSFRDGVTQTMKITQILSIPTDDLIVLEEKYGDFVRKPWDKDATELMMITLRTPSEHVNVHYWKSNPVGQGNAFNPLSIIKIPLAKEEADHPIQPVGSYKMPLTAFNAYLKNPIINTATTPEEVDFLI